MTMIDTPEGIAFAKAIARKEALKFEVENPGFKAKRGQTPYSIVKQVYGFRGTRESVLADLTEYVDAVFRLRELPEGVSKEVSDRSQDVVNKLGSRLTQVTFEETIAIAEERGIISHDFRQAMSDLFYVTIVRQNAGNQ